MKAMAGLGRTVGAALVALPTLAMATDTPATLADRITGNTLSAVIFLPPGSGTGSTRLQRIFLQAHLRSDGHALMRVWQPDRNAYSAVEERVWRVRDDVLCLDIPRQASAALCFNAHVWGPRIAGTGTRPYALLDGDIAAGNTLTSP